MPDMPVAKKLTIREAGKDEAWLQNRIIDDPGILGLGDLSAVNKELVLPQGGRLDILLKNPSDDSMFEVEVQLGPTDPSHIIRTIEYWDSTKRLWPKRSHTAVLVAETITSRFFNVVSLLSQSVPIIGIQVSIVEVGGTQALAFTRIIDSYQEPRESDESKTVFSENHWKSKELKGCLETALYYRGILEPLYSGVQTKYFADYISFTFRDRSRVWAWRRKDGRVFVEVLMASKDIEAALALAESTSLKVNSKRSEYLTFNTSLAEIKANEVLHRKIAEMIVPTEPVENSEPL